MQRTSTLAEQLEVFTATHGVMVTTALEWYTAMMSEQADRVQSAHDAIAVNPARKAAQDISLVTTGGLLAMSGAFREASDRADKALTAWEELTEDDEGSDE